MDMVRTSLGVDPGLEHTDFVFGDDTDVVRVRFRLAENLHQAESIAQQNLDFIRKLYLEQSSPGEYFEQIHLATEFDSTPESAAPTRPEDETLEESEGPLNNVVLRDAMDILFEHLQDWIKTDSISLKLRCHDGIAVATQKQLLNLHKPLTEFSIHNKNNIGNALALWSFAFTDRSQSVKPSEAKGTAVEYEVLSEHFADQYLPDYKQQLVEKFRDITFPNADIEAEKQILLNLANDVDSTKYELLNYQERISGMLEKHMLSVATTSDNPQRKILTKSLPESLGSATDVGLFDMEVIDNAERIWTEINQTIERSGKQQITAENAIAPDDVADDEPPMFELEARAIPTGLRPQRSRRPQNRTRSHRQPEEQLIQPDSQTEIPGNLHTDTVKAVGDGQLGNAPDDDAGSKHNDFFSSPAFALQRQSAVQDAEEPDTEEPETNSSQLNRPARNDSRYLPLLAIVAVAGIYYLIR